MNIHKVRNYATLTLAVFSVTNHLYGQDPECPAIIVMDPALFTPADTGYFYMGVDRDMDGDGITEHYDGCDDAYGDKDHREAGIQNGWEYGNAIIFHGCSTDPDVVNAVKGDQPEENWPEVGNMIQLGKHKYALTDSATFGYLVSPPVSNIYSMTVKVSTDVSILPVRSIWMLIEASRDGGETWEYVDNRGTAYIHQELFNQGGEVFTYTPGLVHFDQIIEASEAAPIKLRFSPFPPGYYDPGEYPNGERLKFWEIIIETNEPPTDVHLSGTSMDENAPLATEVGVLSSTDMCDTDEHSYSLVPGEGDADNSLFAISGGSLVTNAVIDFETKPNYTIRVQTADKQGKTFSRSFDITVNNLNDPPTGINLMGSAIDENLPVGTEVGTLSSTDDDNDDVHTYSLVPGEGDQDNASFSISGDKLMTTEVFDFEVKSAYTVRVQAEDSGGKIYSRSLTINVNDIDDQPLGGVGQNEYFNVYPSPADHVLNISMFSDRPAQAQILDIEGKLIRIKEITGGAGQIMIENVRAGVYIVRLIRDAHVIHQRKIIKR